MGMTMHWPAMLTRSCKTVRAGRVSAEVRRVRMSKIGHLLMAPAIVKQDGTRIVPATPRKTRRVAA